MVRIQKAYLSQGITECTDFLAVRGIPEMVPSPLMEQTRG